jgi:hypothetical protein
MTALRDYVHRYRAPLFIPLYFSSKSSRAVPAHNQIFIGSTFHSVSRYDDT